MKINMVRIGKLHSIIILSLLIATLINVGEDNAQAQSTHQITIKSNCSDSIWIGANPQVQSITLNSQSISTLGGWQMNKGDTALVTVPINWISARLWARTGCKFNAQVCPDAGVGNNPPPNCCDTGGCEDGSGRFALNCAQSGTDPATLAEFTFKSGQQDNYDVSMVDGGNVSVDIVPDPSTYNCASDPNCIFRGNLPNGKQNCTQDSDCFPLFGFGFKLKCDPNLKLCVNPYRCGSPGCSDKSGCAPVGIVQSLLPSCTWDNSSDFAISEKVSKIRKSAVCPAPNQIPDTQNQGSNYVGCIAPPKFCRTKCTTNSDCTAPFACGTSGFCEKNGEILGSDCDTAVGSTTKGDLWGCTGPNSGSCFTTGVTDRNCCGCPNWAPGFPNGFPKGACVAGNNPDWQSVAQPIAAVFNNACSSAYSFAYDDAIKLFTCIAKSGSVTTYTVTFCCVNIDGDGQCNSGDLDADNDGITNADETFATEQSGTSAQTRQNGDLNDFDNDGITNEFDLDSDGDGIPDHYECGGENDNDQDGLADNFVDADEDGHHDEHDEDQIGNTLSCLDTDGDGTLDFIDHDSDNDGITDAVEAGGIDDDADGIHDLSEDANGDGLADSVHPETGTPHPIPDLNGDGIPDHLDSKVGSRDGGCSVASIGPGPYIPFYFLIPGFILIRRLFIKFRNK